MVVGRFALWGLAIGGVSGAVAGLVLGLIAYPPTAWFAVLELGIPGAFVGASCGAFVGLVTLARQTGRSRLGNVWLVGMVCLVTVAVLFAPIIVVGWCEDSAPGGTSSCGTSQRSLIGIDTSIWLWLALSAIVVIATALVARGGWTRRP